MDDIKSLTRNFSCGQRTMTLRFINRPGRELDRAVFARTAGQIQVL
jgi:hypothetical protein